MSVTVWFALGETVWITGLATWIVLERRSPAATFAWVLALAWLPVLGIPLYLLIGPRRLRRKRLRYQRGREAGWLRHPRDGASKPISCCTAFRPLRTVIRLSDWRRLLGNFLRAEPVGSTCFSTEMPVTTPSSIPSGRPNITCIWNTTPGSRTGLGPGSVIYCATRPGAVSRCVLLVDAIGSAWVGRRFLRPLKEAGATISRFNPISLARLRPDLVNFRTHRKIVVCDGRVGFTGGINISDVHTARIVGERAWRDTHLRIEGQPVADLQLTFLEDWHFATGSAPYGKEYFPQGDSEAVGPWVQILASGPDEDSYAIEKFCFAAISGSQERVLVTTPYFVPTEPLLLALTTAALRGVDVQVLVPRRSDSRLVTAASRSYFEELTRVGVRIHQYGSSMLHAKTLVVDGVALVGTANMDNRSFRLNFEVAAAMFDKEIADFLAEAFQADLRRTVEYNLQIAIRTSFWQRLSESTARLLSPLL